MREQGNDDERERHEGSRTRADGRYLRPAVRGARAQTGADVGAKTKLEGTTSVGLAGSVKTTRGNRKRTTAKNENEIGVRLPKGAASFGK